MGIRRLSDDVIVDVNASFEKALGYRRDEVIGKTVGELNFYFSPRERAAALDGAGSREPIRERDVALRSRQGAVVQTILTTDYVTLGGAECALTSFLDITARRQAEDRVRASLREKDVLLKEIYHRVKNNMQVVASLLSLQARGTGDGATRQLLQDSASRIKSMALVHEQLYQGGDLSSIDFAAYLGQLTHHLREVHGEVAERAPIIVQAEPVQLGLETAVPLGLIVNELVSNAYKHAFPGGRRGQVRLRLGWVGEGLIELVVGDDGAGLPQGFEPGQGGSLGMQLVLSLAEQLGGTVVHGRNGDAGSRFALRFAPERAEAERLAAVDTGPGA
jgi:PAS domain S-box-containing protein